MHYVLLASIPEVIRQHACANLWQVAGTTDDICAKFEV